MDFESLTMTDTFVYTGNSHEIIYVWWEVYLKQNGSQFYPTPKELDLLRFLQFIANVISTQEVF